VLVSDDKSRRVQRVHGGALFAHLANASAPRTPLERRTKFGQLFIGADGVNFDAAVRQVPRIAANVQSLRRMLRKIAEADALHNSRDGITPGLFKLAHKAVDCSRQRIGLAAMASYGRRVKVDNRIALSSRLLPSG